MKAKKILMSVVLAVIMLSSSLVLFACGNSASAEETLKLYSDFVTTIEENKDGVFVDEVLAVRCDNSFNRYHKIDQNGNEVAGDHQTRFASTQAIGFLVEYKNHFTSFEGKYDFSNMKTQGEELVTSYNILVEEYKVLDEMSDLNYNIYNGQAARYMVACKNFTKELYDVQNAVLDYLENGVKIGQISEASTDEEKSAANRFNIQKHLLATNEDFMRLFLDSYLEEPKSYNENYTLLLREFARFINFSKQTLTKVDSYTDEEIDLIGAKLNALASSRSNTREAIDNFSFYDYLNDYQGNIDLYKTVNDKAEASYNQIITYFYDSEGQLQKTKAYIEAL